MQRWLQSITAFFLLTANFASADTNGLFASASEPPFYIRSWSVAQGLPSSTVSAITRTRDGYLWIGTDAGLSRFDGVKCRVFGLSDGLKNLQISALLEDTKGVLWIGTSGGGVGRMIAGKIDTFTMQDGLAGDSISSFLENTNGDIWIGTHTGLSIWHDGKFTAPSGKLEGQFIFDLAKDSKGNIWVATLYDGLLWYHDGLYSRIGGEENKRPTNNARCLLVDQQGRIWAGLRERKILCWDNGRLIQYGTNEGFPELILNRLEQTPDGTIWAGSDDGGLYYFQDGRFKPMPQKNGLPENTILSLYTDRDGWLWIGSESGGLGRLGPRRLSVYPVSESAPEGTLRSLTQSKNGDLWAAVFDDGIYRWQDTHFARVQVGSPTDIAMLHLRVEALLATDDGSVWIGAAAHLMQFKNGVVTNRINPRFYAGDRIWCFCSAVGGGLWVGTYNG